jgi:hypothetical protein
MIDKVKKRACLSGLPVSFMSFPYGFYFFFLRLLFLFLVAEKETVILGELAYEQESVDGCDAVADDVGYPLTLADVFLGHKEAFLQCGELTIVFAYL